MLFELVLTFATWSVFADAQTCSTKTDIYCNITAMEQRITQLELKAATRVAYSATGVGFIGGHLKFPHVLLNDGAGYNSATGVFTAPVAGVYLISSTLSPGQEAVYQKVQCFLRKNGNKKYELFADKYNTSAVGSYQISVTASFELNVGDVVDVGACTNLLGLHDDSATSFSGVYVR